MPAPHVRRSKAGFPPPLGGCFFWLPTACSRAEKDEGAWIPPNDATTLCHPNEQKRQNALSREVIENKGTKKGVLHFQSPEVVESKGSYKESYKVEMAMTLCRAKCLHEGRRRGTSGGREFEGRIRAGARV